MSSVRQEAISRLKRTVALCDIVLGTDNGDIVFPLSSDRWYFDEKSRISQRLCSLNDMDDHGITVVNVKMYADTNLEPHTHKSVETVFILSGSYTDPVSGKTFSTGDVQFIPAGTLHGAVSTDGCSCVVTWRPPFQKRYRYVDETNTACVSE